MSKAFASTADLEEKRTTFTELADGVYAFTAEGDPNAGVIIGDDGVMVVDPRATPVLAQELIDRIRSVTDKPITYVLLTHYHAVRVLGASAYRAPVILASELTRDLIVERGQQDFESEVGRFPRLFQAVETVPGLTWPTLTFPREISVWMGRREVRIMHLGKGHTKGDTVAWLPRERVLFSGDLVEYGATPYCGDAYLSDWPKTLDALRALKPEKLVPGRGDALLTTADSEDAIMGTQGFLTAMFERVRSGVASGEDLKTIYDATYKILEPHYRHWVIFEHCLPFNVTRAFDEAGGTTDPRIWTAERDQEMWASLQSAPPA